MAGGSVTEGGDRIESGDKMDTKYSVETIKED